MSKIFISYKYADPNVRPLSDTPYTTTVRHYVDCLQNLIGEEHINKGEKDGEDLSQFKDETIASKLRDKIYDSSVTIVLISPNMKENEWWKSERDQWIPWEISYSLRESTRNGRTSHANAVLAVILPDRNGSYSYFIEEDHYSCCNTILYRTKTLFQILSNNMFNQKIPEISQCQNHTFYKGYHSYIHSVKWDDFRKRPNHYIDIAKYIRDHISEYNITKEL